jgi:hypothetical protein
MEWCIIAWHQMAITGVKYWAFQLVRLERVMSASLGRLVTCAFLVSLIGGGT